MNFPLKIAVTGGSGQLGSELKLLVSRFPQFEFVFFARPDVSLHDTASLQNIFEQHKPDFLINCAAYTAVDKAETEKDEAYQCNATAVGVLAELCRENNCRFIHISTDYVFDGQAKNPLTEDDEVDPVNYYGDTKLAGEELALKTNSEAIIIRTSWVYSQYGNNFVKTMLRLMTERDSIGVVNDQIGSPTYAADLAEAIMEIIASGKWLPGIYHYTNEGIISWFDFAVEIKRYVSSDCQVNAIATHQFPTPAKRPKYSVLDKSKMAKAYSIEIKDWKESLRICMDKLKTA